jgi:hypothetical protein
MTNDREFTTWRTEAAKFLTEIQARQAINRARDRWPDVRFTVQEIGSRFYVECRNTELRGWLIV